MSEIPKRPGWSGKFANAIRGVGVGIHGQNSFLVHLPVAVAVIVVSLFLRIGLERICILLLCIGSVVSCELINSSIERLAKSITLEYDSKIRDALDIASGAVLIVSLISVIVGLLIFVSAMVAQYS